MSWLGFLSQWTCFMFIWDRILRSTLSLRSGKNVILARHLSVVYSDSLEEVYVALTHHKEFKNRKYTVFCKNSHLDIKLQVLSCYLWANHLLNKVNINKNVASHSRAEDVMCTTLLDLETEVALPAGSTELVFAAGTSMLLQLPTPHLPIAYLTLVMYREYNRIQAIQYGYSDVLVCTS